MEEKRCNMLPYLTVFFLQFYVLELIASSQSISFIMAVVNPLVILLTGILYALRHGFLWDFILLSMIVFFPSYALIQYSFAGLLYVPVYTILFIAAQGLGKRLRKYKNRYLSS